MSKRRNPQDKKRDHYDRDFVVESEYSIRKAWPRKKRHAHQKRRAQARDILKTFSDERSLEAYPPELVAPPTRTAFRKPVRSVRDHVLHQLELRRSRLAWNFFKYSPEDPRLRSRFASFLEALMTGRGGEAVHCARIVRWWLSGSPIPGGRSMYPGRLEWLDSFFGYVPELKERVTQWIDRTLPDKASRR